MYSAMETVDRREYLFRRPRQSGLVWYTGRRKRRLRSSHGKGPACKCACRAGRAAGNLRRCSGQGLSGKRPRGCPIFRRCRWRDCKTGSRYSGTAPGPFARPDHPPRGSKRPRNQRTNRWSRQDRVQQKPREWAGEFQGRLPCWPPAERLPLSCVLIFWSQRQGRSQRRQRRQGTPEHHRRKDRSPPKPE